MGEMVTAAGYLTVADIGDLYHVSLSTVRRWARDDKWHRRGSRPVRYRVDDVQASYDKHKAGRVTRHLISKYATMETGP